MTVYSDYQIAPGDNNSPPPVGAPEGMPPSSVNDILREMMSVIRQLGDQVQTTFAGLGDMSQQNHNAVSITGGGVTAVLAGNGANINPITANYLIGTVPQPCLSGYYNINVAHATSADLLGGISLASLLPIGIIVNYYGDLSNVDTNRWAVCDGTRGTPDLRNRFARGAQNGGDLIYRGSSNAVTDSQGAHSHGGATQPHQLLLSEVPSHAHNIHAGLGVVQFLGSGGNMGIVAGNQTMGVEFDLSGGDGFHTHNISTDGAHGHNVSFDPPSFGLWFLMRVA